MERVFPRQTPTCAGKHPPPRRHPEGRGPISTYILSRCFVHDKDAPGSCQGLGIGVYWESMICPECGAEFIEGIHGCPDCRVPLVPALPPRPRPEYVEYVTVLKTGNPIVLAMVKSILASAGIRHFVKGEVLQDLFRGGAAEIRGGRDDEPEARNLLRERTIDPGEAG